MDEFAREGLFYSYLLFKHVFRMMYWVWVPGLLVWGLLALKAHRPLCRWTLEAQGSLRAVVAALGMGATHSPRRSTSLATVAELWAAGVAPATVMAYVIATHTMVVYYIAFLTLLLGIEFAAGQVMGALFMTALMAVTCRYVIPSELWEAARQQGRPASNPPPGNPSGPAVAAHHHAPGLTAPIGRGWGEFVRLLGREVRFFLGPLIVGILLGGFILAGGLEPWWVEGASLLGGGWAADVLNTLVAPFLAALMWLGPVANLPVASNLFKSSALTYPGLVVFLLASVIHPRNIIFYRKTFGLKLSWYLVGAFFCSAALSGLLVAGLFDLFGFRPGPVPLFRELVDMIIMWVPGAM